VRENQSVTKEEKKKLFAFSHPFRNKVCGGNGHKGGVSLGSHGFSQI